jgi:CheY-like chemotaxis protein
MDAHILVVEDSPTIRNLIAMMLRQCGYQVSGAADGLEALAQIEKDPPDLIITDVNMPRMDGFKLIARLRAQPHFAELPIIVLSTESGSHDRQAGLKAGADLYLTKPVDPGQLTQHVARLLDEKHD